MKRAKFVQFVAIVVAAAIPALIFMQVPHSAQSADAAAELSAEDAQRMMLEAQRGLGLVASWDHVFNAARR